MSAALKTLNDILVPSHGRFYREKIHSVCGDGFLKLAVFVQNEISLQTCEEHESLP